MCGRKKDNSEATQESVEYLFVYMYLFISPHTSKIQEKKEGRQIQYTSMQG